MLWTRRAFVKASAGAGAAFMAGIRPAPVQDRTLITKAVPSSGEQLPVVGLGTRDYRTEDGAAIPDHYLDALRTFLDLGGTVVDTAPSYGNAETVLGTLFERLEARDGVFLATKVDREDAGAGVERMERSFGLLGGDVIDLMQVHNLRGTATQLATMREWKEAGRLRYVGVTTSSRRQYEAFEEVMRSEILDFVQLDYSLGNREAGERLLPLAADRGIAVLVNMPYGRGRLFRRVGERELPDWASEAGIESWGQFFLKYVVSHPAVTAAIPGTTNPRHAADNMGAALGVLPDADMRARMEAFYDAIPEPD